MNIIKAYILVLACFLFAGCSSSSSDSGVTAPGSIAGVYRMTISSGAGLFATTGTYTVSFSSTQDIYIVTGDGVNVDDSSGVYTYSSSGSIGVASIVDSSLGAGSFTFTFTSTTSGTFLLKVVSDLASNQSGSFIQL